MGSLACRSIGRRIPCPAMTAAPVGHNGGPPIDTPARKRRSPHSYVPALAYIIATAKPEAESRTQCAVIPACHPSAVLRDTPARDLAAVRHSPIAVASTLDRAPSRARKQYPQYSLVSTPRPSVQR